MTEENEQNEQKQRRELIVKDHLERSLPKISNKDLEIINGLNVIILNHLNHGCLNHGWNR